MKLLAGTNYDPGAAVSKATSSLLAMTAFDTTNLRLTFTAPSNGSVLVRLKTVEVGAATQPVLLLGVLDGATVRARAAPLVSKQQNAGASPNLIENVSIVTGLTPGTSYTWDAAYAVQLVVAATNIKYGGPDDTSGNTAFGGFCYEIWDTPGLLAATHYDPATQATAAASSLVAMTAFDTTNLRLTFTAPSAGKVVVRIRVPGTGGTACVAGLFGVLDGATVRGRVAAARCWAVGNTPVATDLQTQVARSLVTGLTPGTSYTWDAAYDIETAAASVNLAWGGPDNNSGNNAAGGFGYDIWNADSLSQAIGMVI